MNTLIRVLILVVAFAIAMGLVYAAVTALGSSAALARDFEGGERFVPTGARPDFPTGELARERPDFDGDRLGGGWMIGLIRNVGIVAVIVALVSVPKNLKERKKRAVPVQVK